MLKDYYRILKVYPSASHGLIVEAYKALMSDLANGAKSGQNAEPMERMMREAREALETLSQPERRAAYDRQLLEAMMSGGQGVGPAGPQAYTSGNGGAPPPAPARPERPTPYRAYESLKREAELRGRTVEDFLKLQPRFAQGTTPAPPAPRMHPHFTDHMLAEKSPAPEPVESDAPERMEEVTSAEQGLSVAASLGIDGETDRALEVLQRLEAGFSSDPLFPKILWRLGELYFKSLGAPERALAYYRRLLDSHPGSVESLMAEKRVEAIESLNPKPAMDLATAKVVDDVGEVWVAECPHCRHRVNVPARSGVWFICPQCNERSTVLSPGGDGS